MHERIPSPVVLICGVTLYFDGDFTSLTAELTPGNDDWLYSAVSPAKSGKKKYYSSGSFTIRETTADNDAGHSYKQEASFRFPANDRLRSKRLEDLLHVKYLAMQLTNGNKLVMGRNDIEQNTLPKISLSSDGIITEVKIATESITPLILIPKGVTPGTSGYNYTYNFTLS